MEVEVKVVSDTHGNFKIIKLDVEPFNGQHNSIEEEGRFLYFYDKEGIVAVYPVNNVISINRVDD